MEVEASVTEAELTKMEDTMTTETSGVSETPQPEKDTNNVDKVRKRRSSIFQIKSTTLVNNADEETVETGICQEREPPATAEEVGNTHECNLPAHSKDNPTEEEFDLAQYVSSLKEEREHWQNIATERKNERRKLMKKKAILERKGQPLDLNQLSDEERAFIREAPNYEHISDQCSQLSKEAAKIALLNELASKLNTHFIAHITEDFDKTTKQIIQMAEQKT